MKLSIVAGATSQTINVFIQDSSSSTGAGLTGLAFNTAGLTAYYCFPGKAPVAITLATLVANNSAWSSGGFKEIDSTNMPGLYRLDVPNAALAASNGRSVDIYLRGATNMAPCPVEIELTGWDNQNATNGGLGNLDTAVSSRSTLDAPTVWGYATRVLTAGTNIALAKGTGVTGFNDLSATQVENAVWDGLTANHSTAGSYGLLVKTDLDAAVSSRMATFVYTAPDNADVQAIKAVTDQMRFTIANKIDATASIGGNVTIGGYATGQDPATLVLGNTATWTAGTIGHDIQASGGAADPLANPVPGTYPSGTAGNVLGNLTSYVVTVSSPVAANGDTTITRGDDYFTADGRSLLYTDGSNVWPDNATAVWKAKRLNGSVALSKSVSISPATGSGKSGKVELSATDTTSLTDSTYELSIVFTAPDGHVSTLVRGTLTVQS